MASMYDTIMELPLFKGIGEEQLSQMLEKTSVEFKNYQDGETITTPDRQVKSVDFIIEGKVRNTYRLSNFPIEIDEILGKGAALGALRLYGRDTTYGAKCQAVTQVSLLRIEKSQYMNILQSDRIYILNFVNFLSAAAQKPQEIMESLGQPSIYRSLIALASTITAKGAERITVSGEEKILAEYCGVSLHAFIEWKEEALRKNQIFMDDRGIVLKTL